MIAYVSDISQMLNEAPLGNINNAPRLERFIEVAKGWVLLRNRDLMILAGLTEMPLKYHAGYRASCPIELRLSQMLRRFEFCV